MKIGICIDHGGYDFKEITYRRRRASVKAKKLNY
jgi:hypothetical protein